jgi:NAD(P)-dependent dehydrogenase (short-subunit alcohol dehydrogenase family)
MKKGIPKTSPPGTALITGANKGIGYEIARQLMARGWMVCLTARNAAAGSCAAKTLASEGGRVVFIQMNVSRTDSIRAAAKKFESQFEHLDVLINNAGVYPDEGLTILTVGREQMVETFQTNTFGAIEVTQAFLRALQKSKNARVINMSSGYGQVEGLSPTVPSYCLSKLTLNGVTIMFSEMLKSDGIAVNSMSPGWVRTDMGGAGAERSVEQGADTAVWLACDAGQDITGNFFADRKPRPW